jgi:hypothetical protein
VGVLQVSLPAVAPDAAPQLDYFVRGRDLALT